MSNPFNDVEWDRQRRQQASAFPAVKVTPDQETKMTEARANLLWRQPFFAHLLFDLM